MIKLENQRGECIEGIGSTETGYNIFVSVLSNHFGV